MQETVKNRRILPGRPLQNVASQMGTAIQLGVSHGIAGGVALGSLYWITQLRLPLIYALIIALMAACLAGLLSTLNIQYGLYLLGLTLSRLARGVSVTNTGERDTRNYFLLRWPLGLLFQNLQKTEWRLKRDDEQARLTMDLREKALQQAREAAALAERNRIARELHDSIKQQIFSISVSAAAARAFWQGEDADEAREALEDIQRGAREAQVEMQALLQQLRPAPLENSSLVEALKVQAQALGFRTGAQVHVAIDEIPGNDRLLPGTQEAIFRLVQEAFANIARHARAHTIWLNLHMEEDALCIEVRDDGQGFELAQVHEGMGLKNLRERVQELHGEIEIDSHRGQGVAVKIRIPLLVALRSPEEEELQRYTLTRSYEQASRSYQLCENGSMAGLALVILTAIININPSVLIPCILIAAYGYGSGIYFRMQVVLNAGQESRIALELNRRQYLACRNLTRLLGVGSWSVFALTGFLKSPFGWWLLAGILGLLVVLGQFSRRQNYLDSERYYRLLSPQELRWELERRGRSLTRTLLFLSILIFLSLSFDLSLFVWPPNTIAQRSAFGLALIFIIMAVALILEYLQVRRWRMMLVRRDQSVSV